MTSIPISRPYFGEEERQALVAPLETGWVVQGPHVAEFERRFAAYTGAELAVASTSCTTALQLAVAALGLGPGDEVIVPAFTWVATPNVVEHVGARPVFIDIDTRTFNLDPAALAGAVSPRTVGIMPVHLFGLMADMDAVKAVADHHGLWVVEDAACAFGAWHRGRHAGTIGDAGCFSFHPRKSITTGEGGMITTRDGKLAEATRSLRDHGATTSDHARHGSATGFLLSEYPRLGFNYRMTDFQGALGCVQLDRADWILAERRAAAERYDRMLAGIDWLLRPDTPSGYVHGWQAYVTLFRPEEPTPGTLRELGRRRNRLMSRLQERGIATRPGTHAPVFQTFYADRYAFTPEQFPNAAIAQDLSLALPLFAGLTEADQDRVVTALREVGPG